MHYLLRLPTIQESRARRVHVLKRNGEGVGLGSVSLSHVAASSRHMGVGRAREVATGPVLTDIVVVIIVVLCVSRGGSGPQVVGRCLERDCPNNRLRCRRDLQRQRQRRRITRLTRNVGWSNMTALASPLIRWQRLEVMCRRKNLVTKLRGVKRALDSGP